MWFKEVWQEHDYATIIGAIDRIPNIIPEKYPKHLVWCD